MRGWQQWAYCRDPHDIYIFVYLYICPHLRRKCKKHDCLITLSHVVLNIYMLPLKQLNLVMQTLVTAFWVVFTHAISGH